MKDIMSNICKNENSYTSILNEAMGTNYPIARFKFNSVLTKGVSFFVTFGLTGCSTDMELLKIRKD